MTWTTGRQALTHIEPAILQIEAQVQGNLPSRWEGKGRVGGEQDEDLGKCWEHIVRLIFFYIFSVYILTFSAPQRFIRRYLSTLGGPYTHSAATSSCALPSSLGAVVLTHLQNSACVPVS